MTSMFCPHCGAETSSEFSFCPNCGKKLPVIATGAEGEKPEKSRAPGEAVVCPTCGFSNRAGARACESCGTFLGGSQPEKVGKSVEPRPIERAEEAREALPKPAASGKEKKKSKQGPAQKAPVGRRLHLEPYQIAAIAAALLLGGILVYGLMSSKSTASADGNAGGNMPSSQQSATGGQPSPDILKEIDRLREVVNKEPDDLGSILRLSNMLQDNGFYDQAAIYYKRYLDKVPKNVDARVDYGVTLFEGGHTQEAIAQLKDALKTDPKHQIGLFNLGIVYLNAGEFDKANAAFKECVKVDPTSEIGKKAQQTLEQHANITSQEVK
jgi:tetratricopeptide (TPR) repeat protein/predicted RNA-binding Zn-ribbon protein involved in translation (DUF1610 family)